MYCHPYGRIAQILRRGPPFRPLVGAPPPPSQLLVHRLIGSRSLLSRFRGRQTTEFGIGSSIIHFRLTKCPIQPLPAFHFVTSYPHTSIYVNDRSLLPPSYRHLSHFHNPYSLQISLRRSFLLQSCPIMSAAAAKYCGELNAMEFALLKPTAKISSVYTRRNVCVWCIRDDFEPEYGWGMRSVRLLTSI